MRDDPELILKAVAFLRGCGMTVEPWANGFPHWLVDQEALTDHELVEFALDFIRAGAGKRKH